MAGDPEQDPRTARARALRREQTDPERRIWRRLRNRQLGGFKFRRQAPIDRYYADFACEAARLIVELDGDQHGRDAAHDEARTAALTAMGWQVIRFWNHEVIQNEQGVLESILLALNSGRP